MIYDELLTSAGNLYDKGRLNEAEGILRQILQVSPHNAPSLNLMGLIAQSQNLHEQACIYFADAIRYDDSKIEYRYNLAFSCRAMKRYEEALYQFQKVIAEAPQIKEAYNEIACIYKILGKQNEAVFWWQKALQTSPDYAIASVNLAYAQNDLTELENLSRQYPQEPLVWFDLAQINYEQNNLNTAKSDINQALNIQPDDVENNYLAGLIALQSGDKTQALTCFLKAERLDGTHFGAKLKLADIYSLADNFTEAETRYKRLLELNKNDFDVHNNYAEMLYRNKRLSEALEEYRSAILINPQSPETNNNLGTILKDLGDYDEALGLFFNALHYSPDMNDVSFNIVETLVLLARNDKEKALKIAANWLKNYPDNIYAKQINYALKGEKVAHNNSYTEKLFDAFADNYELVMQNLDYSAPLALEQLKGSLQGIIADLGCGSGLAGQAVKSVQNKIIGVDISAKMLSLAEKKGIYEELVKSDIIEFLKTRYDYDWIMAIDVVNYLGNLSEFIRLCCGKKMLFTIESDADIIDYRLDITSRYKHNPAYVEKLLQENGFQDIKSQKTTLRLEAGQPVNGVLFLAK